MRGSPASPDDERGIDFQLPQLLPPPPRFAGFVGTLGVHALAATLVFALSALPEPEPDAVQIALARTQVTPLVFPRELTLSDLLTPSEDTPPTPSATRPAAPKPLPAPAPPAPPKPPDLVVPEPPRVEISRTDPLPAGLPLETAQPQIQPVERPKLAFETPRSQGTPAGSAAGQGSVLAPPRRTVDELGQELARQQPGGGLVVGDLGEGSGGLGDLLGGESSATRNLSALELISDANGVDFKPYLIQILSTVRRNWTSVIPESARLGRRGRVRIQFAIDREGGVPKLVIAQASGAEALDRAAVAGISASTPFPPLPSEFTGGQVRLQFTFSYNTPR
jgi:TonB family protein